MAQLNLPDYVKDGLSRLEQIVESSEVVQFRTNEFQDIADSISICDDLVQLSQLLWRAATSAGFQNFALFVVNQGRSPAFASRLCTSNNEEWMAHYQKSSYQFVDPVFEKAKSHEGSFLFSETMNNSPMEQAFWNDSEKFRIGKMGLCYATRRPNGARIAVSFSTCDTEENAARAIRLNRHDIEALSQLAIECFCFLSSGGVLNESVLSIPELRFLHALATCDDPNRALDHISCFGGNEAMQSSIRRKLNVATIFQAISMASSMQWFDSLPYYLEEIVVPFPKLSGWSVVNMPSEEKSLE